MAHYILYRLLATLPVLFIVSLLAFTLVAITPGDPALLLLQAEGIEPITPADIQQKRAELHLDDPIYVRYLTWVEGALHGDLGRSWQSGEPVSQLFWQRLGNTVLLASVAMALATLIAVPLGTGAAVRRGSAFDALAQGLVVLGTAVPGFWLALVAIYVFSVVLRLLPVFGSPTPRGIILPASVLALAHLATLTRLTRAAVLDVADRAYVTVAHAKGLPPLLVLRRHIVGSALAPIITTIGLETAKLMTGQAIVEFVFSWPGIGKMALDAALLRDTPVIVGFTLIASVIYLSFNLVTDLLVALSDPRVRSL